MAFAARIEFPGDWSGVHSFRVDDTARPRTGSSSSARPSRWPASCSPRTSCGCLETRRPRSRQRRTSTGSTTAKAAVSHRTHGWLVLQSGSVSYGKAPAYLPVVDLLKVYCKIEERDEPRAIREKLTGKLLTLDEAMKPILPVFQALLDLPVEDPEWQALDGRQRRRQTLDAPPGAGAAGWTRTAPSR